MSGGKVYGETGGTHDTQTATSRKAPGKRTRTQSLGNNTVHPVPAPLRQRIETGADADVSKVRLHTGPRASEEADWVNAKAFAVGNDVSFAAGEFRPGTPDGDHLITHEVAHTIQQSRAAVATTQRKSPHSTGGNAEAQADAFADAIVGGQRPPALTAAPQSIARKTSDTGKKARPAARRPADNRIVNTVAERTGTLSNAYGTFTYKVKKNAGANGCSFKASFKAFNPEVKSSKLTFIQTIKSHKAGGAVFYLNNDSAYYSDFDAAGDGTYSDHLKGETDPFYNYEDKSKTDESVGTTSPTKTTMEDGPHIRSLAGERGQTFETAPFALGGRDKGEFFGTLTWGWKIDAHGAFSLEPVAVHDEITTGFGAALRKFIGKMADNTKNAHTPSPIKLEMPLNMCRPLNWIEQAQLLGFAVYGSVTPKARVWVVGRYDAKGSGATDNHKMAMYNVQSVQQYLVDKGMKQDDVHTTALEESSLPKAGVCVVEVSVINT